MARAVVITGGNAGDGEMLMARAREEIERRAGRIVAASSLRRTKAWGFEAPDFLNQALEIETRLTPTELLDTLQGIENLLGRDREAEARSKRETGARYVSRTMDIDIIFYDALTVAGERLTIPHPLLAVRRFVLEPLCEICPGRVHPSEGVTVRELLARLDKAEAEEKENRICEK